MRLRSRGDANGRVEGYRMTTKNVHAQALGQLGGRVKSEKKAAASRANGRKGWPASLKHRILTVLSRSPHTSAGLVSALRDPAMPAGVCNDSHGDHLAIVVTGLGRVVLADVDSVITPEPARAR